MLKEHPKEDCKGMPWRKITRNVPQGNPETDIKGHPKDNSLEKL